MYIHCGLLAVEGIIVDSIHIRQDPYFSTGWYLVCGYGVILRVVQAYTPQTFKCTFRLCERVGVRRPFPYRAKTAAVLKTIAARVRKKVGTEKKSLLSGGDFGLTLRQRPSLQTIVDGVILIMQSTRHAHAQWTTDYNNKKLSMVKFLKVYEKKIKENKKARLAAMTTARRFINRPLIWAQKPPREHNVMIIIIINGLIFYYMTWLYMSGDNAATTMSVFRGYKPILFVFTIEQH